MGHRAEKQMYGNMKKFRAAKAKDPSTPVPHWQAPKIGRLTSSDRREWKQRHLGAK